MIYDLCYTTRMNEAVLYRKYRPQSFKEVLGQEHIISILEATARAGAPAHAYLFAGSRGTGKTSVARIFAREIGCAAEDLYEMDGASNRNIEDVRELREAVRTLPFKSPFKVYIIDEVHMFTTPAFNALLKTLEEPPKHVVFILATTDPEKLPDTILSRCQIFKFGKPSHALLGKMASAVAKKEGFALEPSASELVALLGDGSFRDTHGVLQRVLGASGSEKKIAREFVERVTNAPSATRVNELISAIAERDLAKGLLVIDRLAEADTNFTLFSKLLLEKIRLVLLLRYMPETEKKAAEELTPDELAQYKLFAKERTKEINSHTLLALIDAHTALGRAHLPQVPLELALMSLLAPVDKTP